MAGSAGYLAMVYPPYLQDEAAHVGYTLSLSEGTLPSLETRMPRDGGGPELVAALERPETYSARTIRAANNPPHVYIVSLPLSELTERAGIDGGALLGVRLMNAAGAVAAVACAYLLGRELAAGDDFVGLVTAGLISGLISISVVSASAAVDGPALATTTGLAWALARFARSRSLADAGLLGIWCALACAVRPMGIGSAVVAAAAGSILAVTRHGWRSLPQVMIRLALPSAVFVGWFYLLNLARYGDLTGSNVLFEQIGLESDRGVIDILWGPDTLVQPLPYLLTMIYGGSPPWFLARGPRQYAITAVALGMLAAAVGLAVRSARVASAARSERADSDPKAGETPEALVPAAWISNVILGAVPMMLIAQHMSGGGNAHARYLLPAVPIIAAATALVTSTISRWLSLALVAGYALAHILRLRRAGELFMDAHLFFVPELQGRLLSWPFRGLALGLAAAGALCMVVALGVMAWRGGRAPDSEGADPPAEPAGLQGTSA
jgi:hypothetical protein